MKYFTIILILFLSACAVYDSKGAVGSIDFTKYINSEKHYNLVNGVISASNASLNSEPCRLQKNRSKAIDYIQPPVMKRVANIAVFTSQTYGYPKSGEWVETYNIENCAIASSVAITFKANSEWKAPSASNIKSFK